MRTKSGQITYRQIKEENIQALAIPHVSGEAKLGEARRSQPRRGAISGLTFFSESQFKVKARKEMCQI
jgi:hypothetical protein